jgi:hypothetical protein
MAKSVPEYSTHAGGDTGFADQYFSSLLGGLKYSELEKTVWGKRINTTQITANVIDPQTPTAVKFDIFKRINTGGTPLNSQEIRHCMSGKRSRDLLRRLTSLKSFDIATDGSIGGNIRMADRELVLRWLAFLLLEDLNEYGGDQLENLDDLLNLTTKRIDEGELVKVEVLVEKFDNAMNNAIFLFGKNAFRKWFHVGEGRSPLNRALFEVWGVPLASISRGELSGVKEQILEKFRDLCRRDSFFISSISSGTADAKKVRYRFLKIQEILQAANL